MTTATHENALTEARENTVKAILAWQSAETPKAKRDAAEDLEFWTNKTAFLIHAKAD